MAFKMERVVIWTVEHMAVAVAWVLPLDHCRNLVQQWKDRGVCVCVYTVNQQEEKDYFVNSLKCPVITDTVV